MLSNPLGQPFTIKPLSLAIAFALSMPPVWAAPDGGQVIVGQGLILQAENETRIQQTSDRLSIDWKSFDVTGDERVRFIQPNSSSIAFNRILSNKGSLIQGRIDANGQVVLINPNGLIFTEGASVNAGGLIASALQMNDQDYLNGKFTLNALEGSEGRVINSGLLNAATGGNISLLGQSVENKGLISAQLGSVNLAAGKEAVLTFEPNGLVGVRVMEAVLQKDLGVEAAIINSGQVKAEGGKVLITASTSKDIFSKAVNVGELTAAKSAVVNEDGSFTLGAGADIKNSGSIDVSSHATAGEVVLIGENISQQGRISADSETTHAGRIELSAKNKSEIKDDAVVTAVAKAQGKGGDIKILGDKVGVFNNAKLDASGANRGGQVLLGGDQTGANPNIKNAQFLFVGEKTEIQANATQSGDGGRLIAFAEGAARIYGQFNAKGATDGYGGFVETSGLIHLDLTSVPNVGGAPFKNGLWLIDPANITIVDGNQTIGRAGNGSSDNPYTNSTTANSYNSATIGAGSITTALNLGGDVYIKTGRSTSNITVADTEGNITVNATSITTRSANNSTLYLDAGRNISFEDANNYQFSLSNTSGGTLSLGLFAGNDIAFNSAIIVTNGGDIKIGSAQTPIGGTVSSANATLNTSAANGAGDITIDAKGDVSLGALILSRNFDSTATKAGSLLVSSQGSISFERDLDFNNFSAYNGLETSNENWILANNLSEDDKKTTFILAAQDNIRFGGEFYDSFGGGRDALKIVASADVDGNGFGAVVVDAPIFTAGGNVELSGAAIEFSANGLINTDRASASADNSVLSDGNGNATRSEGGNVTLSSDRNIVLGSITTDHFCTLGTCTGNLTIQNRSSDKSISITQSAGKALSVHGTTTLKTNGGAITLGEASNIFGTTGANAGTNSNANNIDALVTNAKVAAGRTIAITNAGNSTIKGDNSFLTLGNVSAQGLSLSTTKEIRQFASTSIDVNTAAFKGTSVLLINSGNKLGTVTSLETTATSAGTASINTIQDITLSALNIASGQLGLSLADGKSATFDGAITANSAFTVTASGVNTTANLADSLDKTGGSTVTFAGFNTLHYTGANEASWNLTSAAQTVSWSGKTFKFDTATSLVGGSGVDKFALSGTPYSLPSLDGADGDDELTVNAASATANKTWSVELDSASAAAEGKVRATNIKSLTVTNVPSNVTVQLGIGNGKDTTWNLTGATTTYTLNNADLGEVVFTGFNQVAGGDGKDVFDFSNGGSQIFTGKVDGAGGAEDAIKGFNADAAWDLTSTTANFYKTADSSKKYNFGGVEKLIGGTAKDSVTLASSVTEVSLDAFSTGFSLENFEGITATAAGGAKLSGYSGDSRWEISEANEGKITSNGKFTEFANFSELIGAENNKDEFTVTAAGSVTSITGQAGDILNVRSGTTITNNWSIAADGSAQVKEGTTTYINKISGVGTVNASTGADNFTALGTYSGTIKATQGNGIEDRNALTTAKANVVFGTRLSANGIEGITEFKANGTSAELKASSSAGAVNWAITPGVGAGQLSGTVTDATSGKNLTFSDFATLVGGDNDDNFTLGAGTFSGGALQGGDGKNTLINTVTTATWDLSTNQLRTVLFTGMQTLRGLSGDSVKAPNATNAFTLDATSTRLASTDTNNKVTNYTLENFTTLIGGDNQDTFKVDVDAAGVEFQGGKGDDTFTLANETIKTKDMVGGEGSDTVKVTQGTNGWILSAANTGSVNANGFSTVEILEGGAGSDSFDNEITGQTLSLSAIDGGALHATSDVDAVVIRLSGMNSVNNLGELKGFSGTTAWTLNGDGAGTVKTATNASLSFTDVTKIIGGSGNETFTVGKDVTTFDINGGLGVNTLQGPELANNWQLTTQVDGGVNQPVANTGTLNSTGSFTAIQTLRGGSLADSLYLTGSTGLTVTLANIAGFENLIGGTDSRLTANNQTNTWQLNAGTKGLINSIAFENFAKLNGGTALDTFIIANGSQFKGEINGGANTSSSLRDELKVDGVAGRFAVTGQGKGTLEHIGTNSVATVVTFNEIETLTGGSAADTFAIGEDVDMALDGGTGAAVDVISLPKVNLDISLAVGASVSAVNNLTLANFEDIAADPTTNSTLRASDGEATWAITDNNTGSLTLTNNGNTSVTRFSNFNKLVSGSGIDHFIFGDKGSIKNIVANDGDDLVGRAGGTRWDLTASLQLTDTTSAAVYAEAISGLKKWQGGAGADNFNLSAATSGLNNLSIDGGDGQNQLTSPSGSWVWALTGSQQGSLALSGQTISFAKVNTLIAGASQTLNNTASVDAWKINQADQLTAVMGLESTNLNKFNLVNTGAGDDVLDINKAYSGSINMQGGANTVTLGAAGTIVGLSAGSGTDKIKSTYASSLWTQTEENNKRFIKVAQGNTSLIGELTGFESIEVAGAHTLATALTDNSWAIADSVSGTLNGIGFSGFKTLLGSDENDVFSFANGVAFGGTIDGGKGNNLVDVSTGSQTKYELNEAQGSEINGVKNATGVKGAGNLAQLTLVSPNKAAWSITGDNKGELTYAADNKKFSFEGFGVLVGGAGNDTFVFSAPTAKINRIEGGAQAQGGVDTVVAKTNQANLWTIGAGTSLDNSLAAANGTAYLNDYDGIEDISGAGQDKLVIAAGSTQWDLNKTSGALINTPTATGASTVAVSFSGISTLWGSDGKDTYNLKEVPEFADIDGRGGDNLVQLAAQDAVLDLTQGFAVQGVKNVTGVSGSGDRASLALVANSDATWTLTDKNIGTINVNISGQEKSIAFGNFINLTGGANNDAFILGAGYVTGAINGGGTSNGGQNSLTAWSGDNATWSLAATSSVAGATNGLTQKFSGITLLNGSDKNDTFNVQSVQTLTINGGLGNDLLWLGTNGRLIGQFIGGDDINTVQTADGLNTWQLTSATGGSVLVTGETTSRAGFSQVSRLIGGSADGSGEDTLFGLNTAATWDVTATTSVISTGAQGADKTNFSSMDILTGGSDRDLFKVSGAFAGNIVAGAGSDTLELLANGSVKSFTGGSQGSDAAGDKIVGPVAGAQWQFNVDANTVADKDGAQLVGNFQEVETLLGNAEAEDTITSTLAKNIWSLTSANEGLFNEKLNFLGIDYLQGSELEDTFIFEFDGNFGKGVNAGKGNNAVQLNLGDQITLDWSDVTVNGLSGIVGANRIIGSNTSDSELSVNSTLGLTWRIDRLDGGAITDGNLIFSFDGFENIKGAATTDMFNLVGGRVSGVIDGGNALPGAVNNDSLEADTALTFWSLTSTGTGSLTYNDVANSPTQRFSGIETLIGGASNDEFRLEVDGISINIRGGSGTGFDKVIFKGALDVTLGSSDTQGVGVADIEAVDADPTKQNTLRSSEVGGTWTLKGENAGVLQSGSESLTFTNFQNLIGGKGTDEFKLDETARVTGRLSGGEGDNTLRLSHNQDLTASLTADGAGVLSGAGTIARFDMINSLELTPLVANLNARLTAPEQLNAWAISDYKAALNGFNYSGFTQLLGNKGVDTFVLTGKQTLSIDGSDGVDSLAVQSAAGAKLTWQLTDATGSVSADGATLVPRFSNFEELLGGEGNDAFGLDSNGAALRRIDGGAGANSLASSAANNQWQLGALTTDGTAPVDRFNSVELASLQTFNGSGSDGLTGSDDNTNWQVARGGALSLTQVQGASLRSFAATGMGRVKGGKGLDKFTLQETGAGNFAALIGGEGDDSLDAKELSADSQVRFDLALDDSSRSDNQLVLDQIERIVLNPQRINTAIGGAKVNVWSVHSPNSAHISIDDSIIEIDNLSNIVGGAITDTFVMGVNGYLAGVIDGGAGQDKLDYSSRTSDLILNAEAIDATFRNIELVIGNASAGRRAKLKVNQAANWQINSSVDKVNEGQVAVSGGSTIVFSNFNQFEGSRFADAFTLAAGVRADIDMQGGEDRVFAYLNDESKLRLLSPADSSSQATINAVLPLRWQINGSGTGDVKLENARDSSVEFYNVSFLSGGEQSDEFILGGGAYLKRLDGGGGNNALINNQQSAFWQLGDENQLLSRGDVLMVDRFDNVHAFRGFFEGADEIVNNGGTSAWKINSDKTGCFLNENACAIEFARIGRVNSSASGDRFVFSGTAPSISLNARGANDELTLAGDQPLDIRLGGQFSNEVALAGFERVNAPANVRGSTLKVNSLAHEQINWDVNQGSSAVFYGGQTTQFSNFDRLVGGAGNDVFTIRDAQQMPSIDGGLGVNRIDSIRQQGNVFSLGETGGNQKSRQGKVGFSSIEGASGFGFTNIDVVNALGTLDQVNSEGDNVRWDIGSSISVNGVTFNGVESFKGGPGSDFYAVAANSGGFVIEDGFYAGAVNKLAISTAIDEQLIWIVEGDGRGRVESSGGELNRSVYFSGITDLIGGNGSDTLVLNADNSQVALMAHGGQIESVGINFDTSFDRVESTGKGGIIIAPESVDSEWTLRNSGIEVDWWADRISTTMEFTGFNNLWGNQFSQKLIVEDSLDIFVQGERHQFVQEKGVALVQFDEIKGDGTHQITLHAGVETSNEWDLKGATSGTVKAANNQGRALTFSNVQHLMGGDKEDRFVSGLQPYTGTINGGSGEDQVDYSTIREPYTVVVDSLDNIAAVETLVGSKWISFAASQAQAQWFINGTKEARVITADGHLIILNQFGTILGSGGADSFSVLFGSQSPLATVVNLKADAKDRVYLLKGDQQVDTEVVSVGRAGLSIHANNTTLVLGNPGELYDSLAAKYLAFNNTDARNATLRLNKGSQQLFGNGFKTFVFFDNKLTIDFRSLYNGFDFQVASDVFPDLITDVEPLENVNPAVFEAITLYQSLENGFALPDDQRLGY